MLFGRRIAASSCLALTLGLASTLSAQSNSAPRLTAPINDAEVTTLAGNVRQEATAANDKGAMDRETVIPGMQLVLKRSDASEKALEKYIAELHDPKSANFHKWLSNAQIGTLYGPSSADIKKITSWLTSKGFTVSGITPDATTIEFSGTAGNVEKAFNAHIHNVSVKNESHFATFNEPQIPTGLTPVVAGIASLSDFMPHKLSHPRINAATAKAHANGYDASNTYNYLTAADLATIYNFNPLFAQGITGQGQTIVLIEDTDQYSVGDWQTFRKVLGLSRKYPYATLTQSHPTGTNTCTAPGANGDDGEAAIDIEWASAAAPNAAIVNAACAGTTQFGGFLALSNILQAPNPPSIVSISYGESESELGAAENLYIKNLYASAVAQGVSVYVSSGDEGAASSDANSTKATHGITVSGFTSTPYNISVGGTDFADSYLGQTPTYWSTTNGPNFLTAQSYIPEIPWNDNCAGQLFDNYLVSVGFISTASPITACNNATLIADGYNDTGGGSGGPSGCATGAPTVAGVVSGTCLGYAKPSWQSVLGNPTDNVRDVPDVSLMASNGFWGTYYAVCWSDPSNHATRGSTATNETPCTSDPSTWAGFGGTSISSPIWAGIQALVNQSTGQSWGNSNTVLYSLANAEYGSTGSSACNSTLGNQIGANCVFNDVTLGDMATSCTPLVKGTTVTGTFNCYGGAYNTSTKKYTYGVLSTSNTVDQPAYGTNVGWDFATGIGTTNATNIVNAWSNYAVSALKTAQ